MSIRPACSCASLVLVFVLCTLSFLTTLSVRGAGYVTSSVYAQTSDAVAERRARLQAELAEIEKQIVAQQELLTSKQQERVSLERDIAILDVKIAKAKLAIRARDIEIERLSGTIGSKQETIRALDQKLAREKDALAQLLRRTQEIDDYSIIEIILSNKNFSDVFEELDAYQEVKAALKVSFDAIEATKNDVQAEKEVLETKHGEEVELRMLQQLERQKIEAQEKEKQRILTATKGEESRYQSLLSEKQRTAAEIRAALFELRDTRAIPFGTALELAQFAGNKTGVRPALILGVLTQETRLGEFLGTGNYRDDMHPTRDRPLFLAITKELGLSQENMAVSKKPSYGWGGAMGPAQFIPSTWACYGGWINAVTGDCNNAARSLGWDAFWAGPWRYSAGADRLRAFLGKGAPSNPWENRDAFMASALLLKDNGADQGGYAAERLAALRYFAGWGNATNPAYAFYGDGVMEHTANYQKQIDILESL